MMVRSSLIAFGFMGTALAAACSSSSSSPLTVSDAGHSTSSASRSSSGPGSSSASKSSSKPSSSGSGSSSAKDAGNDAEDDADAGPPVNPFECTVPATAPSGGSCVTTVAANDAGTGIQCNPVTNAGCTDGATCDVSADSSGNLVAFVCYPPPNSATVCQSCDNTNGPYCGAGTTCEGISDTVSVCAQYCCTNADCGSTGTCVTGEMGMSFFGPLAPGVGICVAGVIDGGVPPVDATTGDAARPADAAAEAAHD